MAQGLATSATRELKVVLAARYAAGRVGTKRAAGHREVAARRARQPARDRHAQPRAARRAGHPPAHEALEHPLALAVRDARALVLVLVSSSTVISTCPARA